MLAVPQGRPHASDDSILLEQSAPSAVRAVTVIRVAIVIRAVERRASTVAAMITAPKVDNDATRSDRREKEYIMLVARDGYKVGA